jgi:phenylpropionate dioxygenase-like ring-hydroxylating dioxygenase large terminal subunit
MTSEPLRLNVNPQLECAETLASRYYTDPAMLSLEKERIFRRNWQLVGTLSRSI